MNGVLEENLRDILERWGYQEIKVPILGDLDLWKDNNIVKIIDGRGRVLALRPEITSLVIQNIIYENLPIRLYYMGPIFSFEYGEIKESFQIGWELISPQDEWRDIEGLAIIFDVLLRLNIEDFIIEINDTEIWDNIWKDFDKERINRWRKYLIKKDYVSFFEDISKEKIEENKIKDIRNLIFYPRGEIRNLEVKNRLEKLYEFKEKLRKVGVDSQKILISPSLFRPFEYYKGLVFQVYLKELKIPLGGGGSYIQYNKKGEEICGIGFAFREENLSKILDKFIDKRKIYVGESSKYIEYYKLIKEEREKGNKVVFIPYSNNLNINNLKGEVVLLK